MSVWSKLDLNENSVHIMGILNVTPDSFSDGGEFDRVDAAVERALQMKAQGATIIDIGGESTRPGATKVSLQEELDRVIPVIQALREKDSALCVSIDTYKPDVMKAAIEVGANLINDVRALQEEGAVEVAASLNVPVCLMHMQGLPESMQNNPSYEDVVGEVKSFLKSRIEMCRSHGIEDVIIDQGYGFGKTLEQNLMLMKAMAEFVSDDVPLLVGVSRKSMIGHVLDTDVSDRLAGSLSCALMAAQKGAKILRVHDVKETADVIKMWQAVEAVR